MKLSSEKAEKLLCRCHGGPSVNQRSSLTPHQCTSNSLAYKGGFSSCGKRVGKEKADRVRIGAPTLLQAGNLIFDLLYIGGLHIKVSSDKDATVKNTNKKGLLGPDLVNS